MSELPPKLLVIDDDPMVGESLVEFFRREGYRCQWAHNAGDALGALRAGETGDEPDPVHITICDVALPDRNGLDLLREIRTSHPTTSTIILTAYGTIESAVEALRLGAADFLTKPAIDDELRLAMERALRQQALLSENKTLKQRLDGRQQIGEVIGDDPRMREIYRLVEAVAPNKTTVLMSGQSGTGKSLIAKAIHRLSPRSDEPFVEISCGSIPEALLESELFGHVKGAFTGAHADKIGRFAAAEGGTIFLDEINSASPGMQLKLLRVLQEKKFEQVGSSETREVDVRVILASNQPLEALVESGAFRQDLYYRINVIKIDLPPLRERVSDIARLAEHFLELHGRELGRTFAGFSRAALDALMRYGYPGNVRELGNIVERASVLCQGQTIGLEDLPEDVAGGSAGTATQHPPSTDTDSGEWSGQTLEEAMHGPEMRIIESALAGNDWNRQKTADALGINRTTLYKKIKAYGIEPDQRMAG